MSGPLAPLTGRPPAARTAGPSLVLSRRDSSATFREALRDIEKRPVCGGLPMISFLILPMQRVTRLPLLTDVSTAHGMDGHACPTLESRDPLRPSLSCE